MKTKLEEICSYMPYKVKATLSQIGKFNLDSEYPNEHANKVGEVTAWNIYEDEIGGILQVTEKYSFDFCELNEIEIFLRPLFDITSEIEHNGEKFVPIVELAKILFPFEGNCGEWGEWEYIGENKSEKVYELQIQYKSKSNDISLYHQFVIPIEPDKMSWKVVKKLHEWHFWLGDQSRFGKDIIDINNLK